MLDFKILVLALVAACGSVTARPDAAPADDASPPPPTPQGAALLSAAGHVSGDTWEADVQLGAPISATPASNGADQLTTAGTLP